MNGRKKPAKGSFKAKTGDSEADRRAQNLDIHKLMAELERLETALPLHAIERVEQHIGRLDATGQVAIVHGGNAARQRAQKRVVTKTAYAVHALAHAANLIDGTQPAAMVSVAQAINETSGATESSSRAAP